MAHDIEQDTAQELLAACKVAHQAIVDLAYLAAELGEEDANAPFQEGGYAYQANRQIERVISKAGGF